MHVIPIQLSKEYIFFANLSNYTCLSMHISDSTGLFHLVPHGHTPLIIKSVSPSNFGAAWLEKQHTSK